MAHIQTHLYAPPHNAVADQRFTPEWAKSNNRALAIKPPWLYSTFKVQIIVTFDLSFPTPPQSLEPCSSSCSSSISGYNLHPTPFLAVRHCLAWSTYSQCAPVGLLFLCRWSRTERQLKRTPRICAVITWRQHRSAKRIGLSSHQCSAHHAVCGFLLNKVCKVEKRGEWDFIVLKHMVPLTEEKQNKVFLQHPENFPLKLWNARNVI